MEQLTRRPATWAIRGAWLLLAVALAPAVTDALEHASTPTRWLSAAGCWALWTGGLLATLVPGPLALTAVRILAPAGVVLALAASVGEVRPLAIAIATAVAALSSWSRLGEEMVDASSYGSERRLPLRVPTPLLIGPIPLAWAAAVAGLVAGPLLLAARRWGLGGVMLVIGWALAAAGVRALHTLAQRWLVFVPAGLVVHDPLVLVDAVLCSRAQTERIGPALAGTTARDLTVGAAGHALEIALREPVVLTTVERGGLATAPGGPVDQILVSPTRPGEVLAEAATRGFRTGVHAAEPPPTTTLPDTPS